MKRTLSIVLFILSTISVYPAYGQKEDTKDKAGRDSTTKQLGLLLQESGADIHVDFKPSQKQPYSYVGLLKTPLINAESFEILISVTDKDTIGFRIYPHYNKGYVNVDKVKDRASLMKLLLQLSDRAFLFWGADASGDIFTGYTFTLESGFPEESIKIVLRSIVNSDKFVGEMRPFIDGTSAGTVK
jgi:hypothetical protein